MVLQPSPAGPISSPGHIGSPRIINNNPDTKFDPVFFCKFNVGIKHIMDPDYLDLESDKQKARNLATIY
ncbi:hypothetical protein PGT21_016672 [Puccinia graminis f. sp. tritici]|uniref:Uncharacterized protein n=1 Tax=Puccinia graminis f. sp. tritici TaxID=56615 RepID=A0A5B0P4N8_PUCGR|nr:hypothetical protein PGT21_016672 [Puccinia graminis f. sp. tritici]